MPISDVANVSISVSAVGPTQAGFGEPLIAAYHTHYSTLVREYSSLAGMVSDGFSLTEPAYKAAANLAAQQPAPPFWKIGRRALPPTQVIDLLLTDTNAADTYSYTVVGSDGVSHAISMPCSGVTATDATTMAGLFAVTGSPVVQVGSGPAVTLTGTATTNAVIVITITLGGILGTSTFSWTLNGTLQATGVVTAATATLTGTGLTANFAAGTYVINTTYSSTAIINVGVVTHSSSTVVFTQSAGKLNDFQSITRSVIQLTDATTDPGIATDLAAIQGFDSNWYCLLLDSNSAAEITSAAAYAESNGPMLFLYNNTDYADVQTSVTTDIFSTQKALSHARSAGLYSGAQLLSFSAAAWAGRVLPTVPGSENWAFKTLANVIVDTLSTNEQHAVENKNASIYVTLAGLNLTLFGHQPGGEWIDITRGTDALTNQIQIAILALLANNLKVPYTDSGVGMIKGSILGVLTQFVTGNFKGFLAQNPAPTVTAPTVAAQGSLNRIARNMPNVNFTAQLAGAVNQLTITGVLTA